MLIISARACSIMTQSQTELRRVNISYRRCFSAGRSSNGAPSSSPDWGPGLILAWIFCKSLIMSLNLKTVSPLIFRVLPPSQDVSEVRRGSGVLLLSRKTSMESMSTPRLSHTPEIASRRQVPLTAGTRSSHSSPHTSNTAVKNSEPETFPAEESFLRLLRALFGTSNMSLSVSLELSMSSFALTPMASRFVRLFERPWKELLQPWTSWACNKIIRHKTISGRSLLTAGVYHALLPSQFKLCSSRNDLSKNNSIICVIHIHRCSFKCFFKDCI